MKKISKDSPNCNHRVNDVLPNMLILHYTGTQTADEADKIYMTPERVAPHYMVDRDGTVTQYVYESMRAWHAGASSWDGIKDVNSASIGIEVVNGGHEFGLEEFNAHQMQVLIELISDIRARWNIPDYLILGHSDIAPNRKIDPGEKFPWRVLHAAGHGLMPMTFNGDIDDVQTTLRAIGYDYTDDIDVLVREFRRHYMYETFDQQVDMADVARAAQSILAQKLKSMHSA